MKNLVKFNEAKKTAKAIYVLSGLKEMTIYLDGKVQWGELTDEEQGRITIMVTEECANIKVIERKKIWDMFEC